MSILFGMAAALALSSVNASPAARVVTKTHAGAYEGTAEDGVRTFRGIPYAKPPIGSLRWKPPVPIAPHSGVKAAREFGPACTQAASTVSTIYSYDRPLPTSEDCLTLNIWSPKDARNAPVLVWIHGGALVNGSSREPMYDGRRYAERGIVFVSINYRLGVFGWLAHPELSAESDQQVSGNYGLLDQVQALRWVRDNIGAFGGNDHRVTIAGESAGALSVIYLMTSPLARGLFAQAIAQSGYMISMPELRRSAHGAPAAEEMGKRLQGGLGAKDLAAMRDIPANLLAQRAPAHGFAPWGVVDGVVLPEQMVDAFDRKHQAKVPVLAGFNEGEIRSLMMLAPKDPPDSTAYVTQIRERYGDLADAFLAVYPAANVHESVIAATRDGLYGWTAERLVRSQTEIGRDSFLYLFDHGYPATEQAGLHAFHAAELSYTFGNFEQVAPKWPKVPDTPAERRYSNAMIDYWANFVRSGKPASTGAATWLPYGKSANYLHFSDRPRAARDLMPGMFAVNEEVMCRRRAHGGIPWNWNSGIASPKLPPKERDCSGR